MPIGYIVSDPVIANPNKAPVAANGTEKPKTKGAESESKEEARIIKISRKAAPTVFHSGSEHNTRGLVPLFVTMNNLLL